MTGRDRTCDAPRFKRALFRLSYGHANGRSRSRTGGLLLIREALCHLSYPPTSGQGWARTSSLLFVRQALSPLSYSPVSNPGQGVEPRSPRSERGVLPVRRSRNVHRSVHPPSREIDAAAHAFRRVVASSDSSSLGPNDVFHATRLLFDPGSARRRPTWRSFGARASSTSVEKSKLKQTLIASVLFHAKR